MSAAPRGAVEERRLPIGCGSPPLETDFSLAAEAAAIVAMDELNGLFDADGIGRALLARHQQSVMEAADYRLNALAWRNYWTAKPRERLRWLAAVDGMSAE